jgi:excisionase family DNA binding protein
MSAIDDPLLTTREVAEMLAVSPDSVIRMWKAGELPGFRLSSKVLRFRRSEILAALEQLRNVAAVDLPKLRALS